MTLNHSPEPSAYMLLAFVISEIQLKEWFDYNCVVLDKN